ncbi:EVE domain-containing protein [Priestia megaterium]|uniref:EVE domain-containing protein n=1 Tax=Priestia megaterium TaxID=1404 RepID=UPI0011AB13DD|nr:EVE domain-containing protein [Priestia megaterium]MCM3020096.1 EVE domain-containing protein [Priestia megaterium]
MNTWIFQGNPKVFDIDTYIKNHKYIWWSLRQEHFLDKIELDDEVFLWRSDGNKRGTGGILAKARVVSLPQERPNDESANNYWHTQDWTNPYLAVELEVLHVKIEDGFVSRLSLLEHPILKELLILRLRQQTNYLLSQEHAIELQNLWSSNNNSTLLKSHSWEVIGEEIAIKELDKSTFLHHGTGIPKEVRRFFNAIDMKKGERREIVLKYRQRVYPARLEMDKHSSPRSRLLWKADFSDIIRNLFPHSYSHFLNKDDELLSEVTKLKFEKVSSSSSIYLVEFLSSIDSEVLIEDLESEEIELYEPRVEGTLVTYYGRRYERDPINRKRAIEFHGLSCKVCGFNFEEVYGERGKDFIEVHHVKPLNTLEKEIVIYPERDLVPVCANCHRMIHRRRDNILTVRDLKNLIDNKNSR